MAFCEIENYVENSVYKTAALTEKTLLPTMHSSKPVVQKQNIKLLSTVTLQEMQKKTQQTLSNKTILKHLPDNGEKLRSRLEQLDQEIKSREINPSDPSSYEIHETAPKISKSLEAEHSRRVLYQRKSQRISFVEGKNAYRQSYNRQKQAIDELSSFLGGMTLKGKGLKVEHPEGFLHSWEAMISIAMARVAEVIC